MEPSLQQEPEEDRLRTRSVRQAGRVLAIARDELGMDIAYLTEFVGGHQLVRHVAGDPEPFGLDQGTMIALDGSYCQRVVRGELGQVVPDTAADPVTAALAVTAEAGIGAYVGVPVLFEDGRLYGTLCCASGAADPGLAERDTTFMRVLARVVADALAEDEGRDLLEEALTSRSHDLRATTERLAESHAEMIRRLSMAVEYRDDATGGHIHRVAVLAERLALAAGLDAAHAVLIRQAAPLHDVGKVAIGDQILLKPGLLTALERKEMHRHAQIGHDLLAGSDAPVLGLAAMIALTHHERYDGTGYPRGLHGEAIPVEGRIVAIVDVFDALVTDRVYRPGWPLERVKALLRDGRGAEFDPELVDAFLRECVPDRPGDPAAG